MVVALFAACAGEPDHPALGARVRECFRQIEPDCIDSWNSLLGPADPGLRSAMSAYDLCIEAAGADPFGPDVCRDQADALLDLLP